MAAEFIMLTGGNCLAAEQVFPKDKTSFILWKYLLGGKANWPPVWQMPNAQVFPRWWKPNCMGRQG